MKNKFPAERIPYRRGAQEESALQELSELRSNWIPGLNSDNQWLRFAVRLLAELWELAGKQSLTFQLGEPGGPSTELHVLGAPPTQLSSRSGEVRLRPSEVLLLERLEREMGQTSRSAALRHALFACHQVCHGMASGESLWLSRDGQLRQLPSLLAIAASMEQLPSATISLLSTAAAASPSPHALSRDTTRVALLCNEQAALSVQAKDDLFPGQTVEQLSSQRVLDMLQCSSLGIVTTLPDSTERVCVVLRLNRPARIESVPTVTLDSQNSPQHRLGAQAPGDNWDPESSMLTIRDTLLVGS